MTLDQLIAEIAAQPTQTEAFNVLMSCLSIEMKDASAGNSPPPSVQSKYDEVFSGATSKVNEILHAIEDGKPPLEPIPVKTAPASDPTGPVSPTQKSTVFVEKPVVEPVTTTDEPNPAFIPVDNRSASEVPHPA